MAIIATLAIGLGATFTLAGAVEQVLLRPPAHVRDPGELVRLLLVGRTATGSSAIGGASYPLFLDMQRAADAFSGIAGSTGRSLSLGTGPNAVMVRAGIVSANYFALLGASPALGRVFDVSDGFPESQSTGGPPLAVISQAFWIRFFGRDTSVLGRSARIGGLTYTVVGVMPPRFKGVDRDPPDVWLPITVAAADAGVRVDLADRGRYALSLVGRLKPGTDKTIAERQAAAIWRRSEALAAGVARNPTVVAASVIPGRGPDAPREVRVVVWLTGLSAVVLLLACVNVANLLLARALARRPEMDTRRALGADRNRIIRQHLAEGVMYALLSAAAAVGLAELGSPLLARVLAYEPPSTFGPVQLVSVAFVALGAGIFVGLVPALFASSADEMSTLRVSAQVARRRAAGVQAGLAAVQTSFCLILLVAAGLFTVSFKRVAALNLGVDAAKTVRAIVNLDGLALSNDAIDAVYSEMLRRVREIPGVDGVSLAGSDPYAAGRAVAVYTLAHDADFYWPAGTTQVAMEAPVGDGFFRAVGARSLRGRDFAVSDARGAPRVAIINEPLARLLFPGADPLNQCVILPVRATDRNAPCTTVIGVLPGVWYSSILNREKPMVYVPLAQRTAYYGFWRPQGVFVHATGAPELIVDRVRRALQSVRADLPAVQVTMMRDVVAAETRPWRVGAIIFSLFGFVALIVAATGLFGTVSFACRQRNYETAIRLAVGARPRHVLWSLGGTTVSAVLAGLLIGAAITVAARRWVGPLLYQTAPDDIRIVGSLGFALFIVAAMAVALPMVKAMRLDIDALLRAS